MLGLRDKLEGGSTAVAFATLLLVLAACAREDQNKLAIFLPDTTGTVMTVSAPSAYAVPRAVGALTRLVVLDFDLSNPDAFGRATSNKGYGYGLFGGIAYLFNGAERNSVSDLRKPLLAGAGTAGVDEAGPSGGCVLGDANYGGGNHVDLWCFLDGLTPNTDHTAVLARYYVVVRGRLDTSEKLIFGTVANPDSLVPLDGTPGGYPNSECNYNFASAAATGGVTGTQNPFNLGFRTSDPQGLIEFDCLVNYKGLWADFGGSPNTVPIAPNTLEPFSLPRYNYLEVYEGRGTPLNPIPAGAPVLRMQLGIDIDASGNPIPNSFAPQPLVGLDPNQLALADAATSVPDSVRIELQNLSMLAGSGVYKLWALFGDASTQALSFQYRAIDPLTGDTVIAPSVVSGFAGGPYLHRLTADFPADTPQTAQFFLTVEASDAATTPSTAQPLWAGGSMAGIQRAGEVKSLAVPGFRFGTFALGGAGQKSFTPSGRGKGAQFGDELRVLYDLLPVPPRGYQYVGWLASETDVARLPNETFTTPAPEYTVLTDVDMDQQLSSFVTPNMIARGMTRFCVVTPSATAGVACQGPFDLGLYDTFFLTLEPKGGGAGMVGPTVILQGALP